jgi:hypothetical protein
MAISRNFYLQETILGFVSLILAYWPDTIQIRVYREHLGRKTGGIHTQECGADLQQISI